MKYKEWLHDWLEYYEKEAVKARTYQQYKSIIHKRLTPALGDYEMEDLTAMVLQKYIVDLSHSGNEKTGKGLSPNSVISINETIDAFYTRSRLEGINLAIESSHAVAYGMKLAKTMGKGSVLINLSGRGDKDMDYIIEKYGIR